MGASRVRELFERAKRNAPAIIFVDEIDAVGHHRVPSVIGGGNDERERAAPTKLPRQRWTRFRRERTNIILIAATTAPTSLDPALLRPGRFDRRIPRPEGPRGHPEGPRRAKPLTEQVDLRQIAKRTPGLTGADLANTWRRAAHHALGRTQFIDERAIGRAIDRGDRRPAEAHRMNDHEAGAYRRPATP